MCLWCNDEAGTEPALSVVVYYCRQWKRNLNLAAQPAVNQYFTGSVLWRDDTKTDLKEERWGGGEESEEEKNLPWHPLTYFSTKSERKQAPGTDDEAQSHSRTLQPLQELLLPACLPCYCCAGNGIKSSSNTTECRQKLHFGRNIEPEDWVIPACQDPQSHDLCMAKDLGGRGPPLMRQPMSCLPSNLRFLAKFELFFNIFSFLGWSD